MKFKVLEVFPNEEEFGGDYYAIRVELDGEVVATYGDYYHDKGADRARGFIHGYCFAKGVKIPSYEWEEVVDPEI